MTFDNKTNAEFSSNFPGIVSEKKELDQHYKLRKSKYNLLSIHSADKQEYLDKGWEIRTESKKKIGLKKIKSHDKTLEDRVWCLLYKMGYTFLNGKMLSIQFEMDTESKGKKQIDVFAYDAETAIVVECKAKEERGRRSLQKDISETIYLQRYIRESIYKLYGTKPRPKIIWAYITQNIIWSENDVKRARDGKIEILTENELQYYEAFIDHMGPAGKYQVLGEFLKGQKIPGLDDVRLPAIKGHIGGEIFYSFVISPRVLLKLAFINHQALNHPDGRPAYQRMISSARIKDIGKFISQKSGFFPTNLLVNFTDSPRFDLISNKDNSDPHTKFGWITLPAKYRSAWIIDGQHRLYGYSHLADKFLDQSLFVLAFDQMNTRKEAELFITINHKQKSVPKSLLVSLLADINLGDSDPKVALSAVASSIIRNLNIDKTSPLSRRFTTHGVPPEPNQNLTISEAVNGLTKSGLIGKIAYKTLIPGPLNSSTDEKTLIRASTILNAYFEKIRSANPTRWEAGRVAYICINPGIRAHFMLIAEIISYLRHKESYDFDTIKEDILIELICKIATPFFEYVAVASDVDIQEKFSRKFGEGGVKEYIFHLYDIIQKVHHDFGTNEFKEWISKRESNKITEATTIIIDLSEKMTDTVVNILKSIYGTNLLESGERAFWELGIESRRVKDNAYKKQQDEKQERKKGKEAYLDIVDLIEIVKQRNNWPHFKEIFNLPREGDRKGNIYYLDWMNDFNELRKIAAHKNSLRTYSDKDLEFLEWLKISFKPVEN